MEASLPASSAVGVATRIGTLRLRRPGPADIGRFGELRRTLRGVELWRAFLAIVGVRDSDDSAASPATVEVYELSLLSDDDLERTAERYLGEAVPGNAAASRRDGERSAEYAVRVLEAQLAPSASVTTTIDRLAGICETPAVPLDKDLGEIDSVLPEPAPKWDVAKQLVEEMKAGDDAVADAQKRVEEIQDLLGRRERAWVETQAAVAPLDAPRSDPATPVSAGAAPAEDGALAPLVRAQAAAVAEHERALAALGEAARANTRMLEELRAVAESLTSAMAEIDGGRKRSDAFARRGVVAGIVVLVVSCALSALALLLEQRQDRALRTLQTSVEGSLAAQQQVFQTEVARLSEERASLLARVEQLEAERNAARAEAAKPAEVAAAPEPVKAASTSKAPRAKSGRSARAARTASR